MPATAGDEADDETPDEDDQPTPVATQSTGTAGGEGRATISLPPSEVATVVTGTLRGLLARSRGGDAAFELVALLGRRDNRFRKITVRADSDAAETRLTDLDLREQYGVDVLALRRAGEWQFTPSRRTHLQAGDELFAAGPRAGLNALTEVSA